MINVTALTPKQSKLLGLLSNGFAYSVMEIANILHIGDPRSEIRHLRNKGIPINDFWQTSTDGKFKKYYIPQQSVASAQK